MKSLAIIIADDNAERLRTALVLASAHAALGGKARLFFQGSAVAMLRAPIADLDDGRQSAAGLPTLAQLFDEASALGIGVACCQSSLALLGLTAADFPSQIDWSGMIVFLASAEPDEQLLVI